MSFPTYITYKDSGTDIFSEVPSHWSVQRLKNSSVINMGQSPSSDDYNIDGDGHGFLQGNADFGDEYPVARSYCPVATKLANPGDILFSVRAPVGAINTADQIYGIGRGLCSITATESQCSRYLYYSLHLVRQVLLSIATGSTYEAVTVDQVANAVYLAPPLDEQKAISSFLDVETSKIDALVAEQRRLIELLKEKRQAVISHTVTKGLNPDAPLKDSGIEWLGEVPQHWTLIRLRHACSHIFLGLTSKVDYVDEGGVPLVRALNIKGGILDLSDVRCISEEQHASLTKRNRAMRDDVLLSKSGSIGTVAIVDTDTEFSIYESIFVLRSRARLLRPVYLLHLLRSQCCSNQFLASSVGMGVGHLNMSDIVDVYVALPPEEEQEQIASHLDSEVKTFSLLQAEAERAIELLQERRTALISAAVTGKIDVREYTAQETA